MPVSMMVLRIPIRTISFDLFATFCGSSPTWSFLICYSCSFYSSMIEVKEELAKKPVNYDGKIKAYQFEPEMCNTCFWRRSLEQTPLPLSAIHTKTNWIKVLAVAKISTWETNLGKRSNFWILLVILRRLCIEYTPVLQSISFSLSAVNRMKIKCLICNRTISKCFSFYKKLPNFTTIFCSTILFFKMFDLWF